MLSTQIKENTKQAHQELEKAVILRIKEIQNNADYAEFLKHFYAYFHAVEQAIAPYITAELLPDYATRRNSSHIKADIISLGSSTDTLPDATAPVISSAVQAMGALYVLEGSIMGGPYIVQVLQKRGIEAGFSFFSGYGAATGQRWGTFVEVLNAMPQDETEVETAVNTALQTFSNFGDVFRQNLVRP